MFDLVAFDLSGNINEIIADIEALLATHYSTTYLETDASTTEDGAAAAGHSDHEYNDELSTEYLGSDDDDPNPATEADGATTTITSDNDNYTYHLLPNEIHNLIITIETGGGIVVATSTSGDQFLYSYPNTSFEVFINNSTGQVTAYEGVFPLSYDEINTLTINQIEEQDNQNAELQYNNDSNSDNGFVTEPRNSNENHDYLM